MTICCVPNGIVTEMWLCVCLVLLVPASFISPLPIQEALSTSINTTEQEVLPAPINATEPEVLPASINAAEPEVLPASINATEPEVLPASINAAEPEVFPESVNATEEVLLASINAAEPEVLPASINATEQEVLPASIIAAEPEVLPASINATEQEVLPVSVNKTRLVRQLDFTECCPCPKNRDGVALEVLEALPSNPVQSRVLPQESGEEVLRDDDGGVGGCSCQQRDATAAAAATEDFPRQLTGLRSALTSPKAPAAEDTSILKPEVGLASSFLETLREATDEEYRDAVERDAQRSQARSQNAENEGNNNVVTILVAPYEDKEDKTLTKASNVQSSKRVPSPLSKIARKNKPVKGSIRELLGLPSSRTLKDKKTVDNEPSASEVNEKNSTRQREIKDNLVKSPTVKLSNEPAKDNGMDILSAASSNIEIFTPNSNQPRSNTEEQSKSGRSSISDDFLNLRNVKDIVGEREIKLKVPYLKVPSLINKDASSRSSVRKIPTLSELFEDIISPTIDDVHPTQESENRLLSKEEAKKVDDSNDDDDDDDATKFKTRILDTLPSPSHADETNIIPSNSVTPSFSEQSLDPERENIEDNMSNDPEGYHSIPNPIFLDPISPVFIPEERSSIEMNSVETFTDDSSKVISDSETNQGPNQVGISKGNSMKPETNKGAILEKLDKLSKISTDLEKIKDLVEDMSKSKLETNQPKSGDSDTGASDRHENISILPNKVLQAPQTLSRNFKKIGNKFRLNKKGMLGASSDRIQSLTLPRLSDLTNNPFDVFNLMLPQDKIVQPSFLDPSRILPWDLNYLKARAVPELPSVDEIRDRISDFIGRSGLGINTLSDMDDDSNTNHPIFALGKPRGNQQTELVDLDVFRLRPLKAYSSNKSRLQQPVQGFNLEKFKAKVQVPTKSVKAVELQSTFGKDGRIVGGRFSLQPPNEAFWDKVRNTKPPKASDISNKQPTQSLDSLKLGLKAHADDILESVKSNAPLLSSPLVGGLRSQVSPHQKTSSSIINEVRERVNNVLGATNAGQRELSLKDSLLERKATIENRIQEIHSDIVQQIGSIDPLTTKNTHAKDFRNAKSTVDSKTNKPRISSLLSKSQPESDRTKKRISRPKSNTELREQKVKQKRLKDAKFSPSNSITIKSMPDRNSLKRVILKDDQKSQSAFKPITKISSNGEHFERKGSDMSFKSPPPLLRSVLKRKNLDSFESVISSTVSSIPSIKNLKNRSGKFTQNLLSPESVILEAAQPKVTSSDGKLSDVVFENFNEKIQSRLTDIDARAKKMLQSSKHVQFEEPQLGSSENHKRISFLRPSPIKQEDEESKTTDTNLKGSSTARTSGPSWQKLTERIQSRISEAEAAVKKSLENSNPKQRSKLHGNPNEMSEDASETETKHLNSPRSSTASTSGPSLQKLTEIIQSRLSGPDAAVKNPSEWSKSHGNTPKDMAEGASETEMRRLNSPEKPFANLKTKLSDANEALKQAIQNAKFAKDSDSTPSELSEAGTKSKSANNDDRPLAKLAEILQSRLAGTTGKNIMHGSKDKQPNKSNVQDVSERQFHETLSPKSSFGENISKRLHNINLRPESDLEHRATENHDSSRNKELVDKNDALPLDKLREKLQTRFSENDKSFKNVMKGSAIVQPTYNERSVEAIEDFGTESFTPLKKSRPLLNKITERMQNRNLGARNMFANPEIAEPKSSPDSNGDSRASNIMKVSPTPLLERLAENHRLPSLSRSSQPVLGAAPANIKDMNEEASENMESSNPVKSSRREYVPLKTSPILGNLTKKLHNTIFREENPSLNNVEDELMVPNSSENVPVASKDSNKPMKQNVTYRCRMVCEEVSEKK